jgi:hypothetical protein
MLETPRNYSMPLHMMKPRWAAKKESGQEVSGVGPFNGFLSAAHLVPPFLDVKGHFTSP